MQPLGLDLGYLLGYEMEHKNELSAKGVEPAKFDSRRRGSSVFDVPRCGKTLKNRCQNHCKIELQHDANSGSILERFRKPSWGPKEAMRRPKVIKKLIEILTTFELFRGRARG